LWPRFIAFRLINGAVNTHTPMSPHTKLRLPACSYAWRSQLTFIEFLPQYEGVTLYTNKIMK